MDSKYLTDEEYERYWVELEGIRESISRDLGLTGSMKILDIGTGWGFFAISIAKQLKKGEIVGIDIVPRGLNKAREFIKKAKVEDVIEILRMDATKLSFPKNCFDLAVSFLGMRDIHMTRGKEGVKEATKEMIRVTKPGGKIALCVTPPEDAETEDEKLAIEVEGEVFGAKSLPKQIYADMFRENKVVLKKTRAYYTNKKLTAKQAETELKEGIEIARRIYGKNVPGFKEMWKRYKKKIEAFGYGMYSKIVMVAGKKSINCLS